MPLSQDRPTSPLVRPMASGETGRVIDVLTEAFQREDLASWMHPEPAARRDAMHALFDEVVGSADEDVEIDVTDDLGAAAVWYPPGHRAGGVGEFDRPDVTELFRQIDVLVPPGPHWYLAFLGAARRGGGGGRALLTHRLGSIEGPASLWTATEANLAFYARFGFEVAGEAEVPGRKAWWMVRP